MKRRLTVLAVIFASALAAQTPAWVEKSNRHAQVLLGVMARFEPEDAASLGVEGLDDRIVDLKPKLTQRSREATAQALAELQKRRAAEKDPLVLQDLEIMIKAAQDTLRQSELLEKYTFPYLNMTRLVFGGVRGLLDDQIAPERRQAALVRLRRYAGMEDGYTPVTVLAQQRTRERLKDPSLLGPPKAEVEKDLATASFFLEGIPQLFDKYKITGYQDTLATLKRQLAEYNAFVKAEVLPRARTDFRLPAPLYAMSLENYGVDIAPEKLAAIARAAFTDLQKQMEALAPKVAKEKGFQATGYRDVIRQLKKEQIGNDAILNHYKERLASIEQIIRKEHLVTLPDRPARIRLASPAESAAVPAPNMRPPRLVGNRGEQGEFVLPLAVPSNDGKVQAFDDFSFAAASWTLTAHEARPGHELQFAAMVERGVSAARGVFAFNSANVEGWGLYAESILFPYMPAEGQLISLQHRMMRAARAFLDPELQLGKVTPEQALHILKDDVVLSDAMANQEVERYMFRSPGQATAYFYGYTRLNEIRRDTEKALGARFNPQRFHDFVLSQGLLPPTVLRKAVMSDFVGAL